MSRASFKFRWSTALTSAAVSAGVTVNLFLDLDCGMHRTGVAPGAHFGGADGRELSVFEATHGTATHLAGTNRADPIGLILSGAMLLRHIGETDAGDRLEAAVAAVIAEGRTVTYDLRPTRDDPDAASTTEVRDAVVENLLSR